ncbi:YmfQ family protein [Reyranella sp.]|uniref:YmfQ family protein n=1 Tax=Reyranella sp. TaxID=1929291 RepID=UPI00272FC052|nr:putative phage tail protein [Reyranella sp.]MDP2375301.1 DUF2313 domain-containing protein [Reyranella sp.]
MAYDQPAYAAQLQALLPTGAAWSREGGATLTRLLEALAFEMARLDIRVANLFEESDPRTAQEMIADWERVLGLPDPCTVAATTLAARQLIAWRKLAHQAGQTPAFYIALAASIGMTIEIFEQDPDVDDHDPSLTALIGDNKWRFCWRVHVLTATDYTLFRVGTSAVGERLVEGGAIDLECMILAARPAHTRVVFTYEE